MPDGIPIGLHEDTWYNTIRKTDDAGRTKWHLCPGDWLALLPGVRSARLWRSSHAGAGDGQPGGTAYDHRRSEPGRTRSHYRLWRGWLPVEVPSALDPFGAKGVGEPPVVPVAAAIANAIKDAVGVRMTQIPMTPERVFAALREEK